MKTSKLLLTLVFGVAIGVGISQFFSTESNTEAEDADAPLYWVAPMDSNYRRDQPGKSPMGMDLVPVYAEDAAQNSEAGKIYIAPNVVNNLGVKTATVRRAKLKETISTVGYVQYDQDEMLHIHPRVEGWVEKLYVKAEGDPVAKGEPLYSLYSPELVNAQEELLIAVKRNNSRLITAAKARLEALHIPDAFIEQVIKQRKVQQTVVFYSPKSGVLDGLKIREGFYVGPKNTLMSIAQIDQVWVEAQVLERDTAMVAQGQAVTMTLDAFPGEQWQGKVDYIYPVLDPKTRTLRARLKFANPKQMLKPNMFAQLKIAASNRAPQLVVPREAVIRTGEADRVVLAYGNGEFKSVNVTLGQVTSSQAEIVKGLKAGDELVLSAQFLIDSESSKNSDFMRMAAPSEYQSAQVFGVINAIDLQTRVVNISRSAIVEWDRPAATMDFLVSDQVYLPDFKVGDNIDFNFEIRDDFVITDMALVTASLEQD